MDDVLMVTSIVAVRACRWTSVAVPSAPYVTSIPWIDHYGCKYVVHGDDITSDSAGEDCYRFVKAAERFWVVKRTPGISTTDLVGRMLLCTKSHFIPSLTQLLHGECGSGTEDERKARGIAMTRTLTDYASDRTGQKTGLSVFGWGEDSRMANFVSGDWKPRPWQRVIYIDGGFDLFTPGHINFLRTIMDMDLARYRALSGEQMAEDEASPEFNGNFSFIVVGIHSDPVVNKHKGYNYPIMNLYERMLCVLQCGHISSVIFDAPFTPSKQFLDSLPFGRPHTVYHGATTFMPSEQDPYVHVKEMGIYQQTEAHGLENLNAELIMSRISNQRELFVARQEEKARKGEVEQLERERQTQQGAPPTNGDGVALDNGHGQFRDGSL